MLEPVDLNLEKIVMIFARKTSIIAWAYILLALTIQTDGIHHPMVRHTSPFSFRISLRASMQAAAGKASVVGLRWPNAR